MERSSRALQWGAFFASLFMPGAGHAIAGHPNRGTAWLAVTFGAMLAGAFAAWWWLGALLVGLVLGCVLYLACCVDAFRAAATRGHPSVVAWVVLAVAATLSYFVVPVVLALVIRFGALEAFKTPSGSMCPTLAIGDHFFLDKTAYRFAQPKRGDIIVYTVTDSHVPVDFVHRVVAVGGDRVDVERGDLYVNGQRPRTKPTGRGVCEGMHEHEEDLGTLHTIARGEDGLAPDVHTRVPPDSVFVMGDNRDNSHDSRHKGAIAVGQVKGKLWRRWMCGVELCWNEVR